MGYGGQFPCLIGGHSKGCDIFKVKNVSNFISVFSQIQLYEIHPVAFCPSKWMFLISASLNAKLVWDKLVYLVFCFYVTWVTQVTNCYEILFLVGRVSTICNIFIFSSSTTCTGPISTKFSLKHLRGKGNIHFIFFSLLRDVIQANLVYIHVVMVNKKGTIKIVNFITPRAVVL